LKNGTKNIGGTLFSLYKSLPDEDRPIFGENLVAYQGKLEKSINELQGIIEKKSETTASNADSKSVSNELADIKKQLALLEKQQPATKTVPASPSASTLKAENPQQYKNLVSENKAQLLEASKLLSNKNIIARVKPSVAYIETTIGAGSGVVVGADGYILTNAHVVSGVNSATVKLANGGSFNGTVIGRDENIDLALLKISATNLSAAFLGDSDLIEQGDPVFTFGYPLGIEGDVAFKDGTLSRRQKIDGTTYLEISAQILPGNSGGPLVNQSGEIIGINTLSLGRSIAGISVGETLKYAIPINVAKSLIPELKNGRNVVIPKSAYIPKPTPSTPAIPPSTYTPAPAPEPKPEPVRTTISNIKMEESPYAASMKASWSSNKGPIGYYGDDNQKVLVGKNSDLSDAKSYYSYDILNIPVEENTTYYYQVVVKDTCTSCLSYDPNEAKSQIFSIITKERTQRVIDTKVTIIDSRTAEVTIETNLATVAVFGFRRESETRFMGCSVIPDSTSCEETFGKNISKVHKYLLTNLSRADKHYYRVSLIGGGSNYETIDSDIYSFNTPAEQ
jgi:S1-C subfamily serine protease